MSVTVDGVKTFRQLQVPSSDLDNGLYTVTTTTKIEREAYDDQIQYQVWFTTPELDEETIKRLHSLQLLAESRDQGFADVPSAGNWTWFEIGVYVDASARVLKKKDGVELAWKSHPNRFMSNEYDWSEGIVFDKKHEIFGVLSPGNVIGVRLCARFTGWTIMVNNGFLVIELGPKLAKRTVPEFKPIIEGVKAMEEIMSEVNAQTNVAFIPSGVKALGIANTYSTFGDRPLRVLSLDGGGVRGLSSLYILQDVMDRIAKGKKPCEVFDMIAGTSAGGLIAIMLGRLEMSVEDCITKYEALSAEIFVKSFIDTIRIGRTGARYESSIVETAFQQLVEQELGDKRAPLLNENGRCKVFVMAVRADADNNREPVYLRSYTNTQTKSLLPDCLVWEAGRATSAAPTYFTPIKVGGYELVDGGLLANNPLGWLWSEVLDVFGPARRTDCFLSIGTGIPANHAVGTAGIFSRDELAKGLGAAATNTQLTHILFKALLNAYAPNAGTKKYWRLNVGEAIPGQDNYKPLGEMDDLTKITELRKLTKSYIEAQGSLIDDCASTLRGIL